MTISCRVYAKERRLLGLKRRLNHPGLEGTDREKLLREIADLERDLGLDRDPHPIPVRPWRKDA